MPLAGKFKRLSIEDGVAKYCFMPHLDMIGSGNFSFPENEYNVSPFSKSAVKFAHTVQTVSLTAIAAACQMDRENVATLLKAIFVKFVSYRKASSSSFSSL